MRDKVLVTLQKYAMIEPGETVAAAVSGGADSVALFHLLCSLRDMLEISLMAIHLNHNLRGDESERDARFVQDFCNSLGIPFHLESLDIASLARERGLSVEICAREARYSIFRRICPDGKIATGHNANDNIETVLLNLTRGTSIRGLGGIPPVRGHIIRPLIECGRDEIETYCQKEGLSFVTDSTNMSDDYTRNLIRHHVIPRLETINPALMHTATESVNLIRRDADYLDFLARNALDKITIEVERYRRQDYINLPIPLSSRILISLLKDMDVSYHRERIQMLDSIIRVGGILSLRRDLYFVADEDSFYFTSSQPERAYFECHLDLSAQSFPCEITLFPGKTMRFTLWECEEFKRNCKSFSIPLKNGLDYDRIEDVVTLRQRKPGDKLRLSGRGVTKSLKKLFNEAKTSFVKRSQTVVLESGGLPILVEGFGVSETCAVRDDTKRILCLETVNTLIGDVTNATCNP